MTKDIAYKFDSLSTEKKHNVQVGFAGRRKIQHCFINAISYKIYSKRSTNNGEQNCHISIINIVLLSEHQK